MCGEIIKTCADPDTITTCDCGAIETYIDDDTREDIININTNKISQKTLPINKIIETNPDEFVYTKIYNKLVRDKVPTIITSEGNIPSYIVITNKYELIKLFENKICEEWNEYLNAETEEQKVEEIGDLIEVLFSLAERYGETRVDLTSLMINKNLTKGQFKNGVFLIDVKRQGKEIE
jgi:predicted house-cleaning noncanonical NTP pyrophosphatase (MazG superfamily)